MYAFYDSWNIYSKWVAETDYAQPNSLKWSINFEMGDEMKRMMKQSQTQKLPLDGANNL